MESQIQRFTFTCWFSLNNSETVKTLTLAFCSIQLYFIRNFFAKFGIPSLPCSIDIEQNSDGCISDFRISGQFLIKRNCHNSRTSDNIDIKFEPVTKLDKKNKTTTQKLKMRSCQKIVTTLSFFNVQPNYSNPESGYQIHSL